MKTKSFERENRYLVLKLSDVNNALTELELKTLRGIAHKVSAYREHNAKLQLQCVVVEHDWPKYEPTWAAIQKRVEKTNES